MKTNTIFAVLIAFSFHFSSTFAQEVKTTIHPNITILSEEGKEDKRIYQLPCNSPYSIKREGDTLELLKGEGREVDISSLAPGVYYILFTNPDETKTLDKFSIDWN